MATAGLLGSSDMGHDWNTGTIPISIVMMVMEIVVDC